MVKTKRWGKEFKDKRDWKIYNEELIIRGEFFVDFDFIADWDNEISRMNKGKLGHPYEYPNSLFEWASPMYSFLDSRKLEGVLRKMSHYIPKLRACDHSTIIKRLNKLELVLDIDKNRIYRTAVDTTGNKFTNRGEFIRHKWKVHRGWLKVSILIDRFTKDLLDVQTSVESVEDYELAKKHLENVQDLIIEDMAADGAYYVKELYDLLKLNMIKRVIKMPKNAVSNGFDPMHSAVREMIKLGGYEPWRDKFQYGHRWNIEGYFSSAKRLFGETVRRHNEDNCFKEAKMKIINYERIKKYAHNKIFYERKLFDFLISKTIL